jgi:hypothetical protein
MDVPPDAGASERVYVRPAKSATPLNINCQWFPYRPEPTNLPNRPANDDETLNLKGKLEPLLCAGAELLPPGWPSGVKPYPITTLLANQKSKLSKDLTTKNGHNLLQIQYAGTYEYELSGYIQIRMAPKNQYYGIPFYSLVPSFWDASISIYFYYNDPKRYDDTSIEQSRGQGLVDMYWNWYNWYYGWWWGWWSNGYAYGTAWMDDYARVSIRGRRYLEPGDGFMVGLQHFTDSGLYDNFWVVMYANGLRLEVNRIV